MEKHCQRCHKGPLKLNEIPTATGHPGTFRFLGPHHCCQVLTLVAGWQGLRTNEGSAQDPPRPDLSSNLAEAQTYFLLSCFPSCHSCGSFLSRGLGRGHRGSLQICLMSNLQRRGWSLSLFTLTGLIFLNYFLNK